MNEPFVAFTATTDTLQGSRVRRTEYQGVLRLAGNELVLEFTMRSAILGGDVVIVIGTNGGVGGQDTADDGEVHTARIPLEQIGELEVSSGLLFQPRIDIEVNRLGALATVPWAKGSRVRLRLARRDARRARELAVDTRLRLAEAQLRRLGEPEN